MSDVVATIPLSDGRARARALLSPVQIWGAAVLGTIACAAIIGPLVSPYGANETVCAPFATPSATHPLGCNDVGQDLLTSILAGGRVSLAVGLSVAAIATLTATLFAVLIGTRGGATDLLA
ncbi:MAG: hypothetical protein AAFW98_17640, partial [Pseudomonadota bacterium]